MLVNLTEQMMRRTLRVTFNLTQYLEAELLLKDLGHAHNENE